MYKLLAIKYKSFLFATNKIKKLFSAEATFGTIATHANLSFSDVKAFSLRGVPFYITR